MTSPDDTTATDPSSPDPERADLLDTAREHRELFLIPVRGVTDAQARTRSTVSELTLGGLVKHVTATEAEWVRFITEGPAPGHGVDWGAVDWSDPPPEVLEHAAQFTMTEDETLDGLVEAYLAGGAASDALLASLPDLAASQPLPAAPWFEPGVRWSARRVFLHMIAETAQHAGHADLLREAIDGQKSMG